MLRFDRAFLPSIDDAVARSTGSAATAKPGVHADPAAAAAAATRSAVAALFASRGRRDGGATTAAARTAIPRVPVSTCASIGRGGPIRAHGPTAACGVATRLPTFAASNNCGNSGMRPTGTTTTTATD